MSEPLPPDWTPKSIEDLADEALDGWEEVLPPALAASIHELVGVLYETHPVLSQFADEALAASRAAPEQSEQGPNKIKLGDVIDAEVKKQGAG